MNIFRTLNWQMNTTYVGSSTNDYPTPSAANTRINGLIADGLPTPIPVLFGTYNDVKTNAFSNNLLEIQNNQVLDVAGRTQSPYKNKIIFAASPAIAVNNTGSASFLFKKSIFFKNTTGSASSFYIDFDDGKGYKAVGWETPISVNYEDTGMKQLKIKMLLNNGNSYECYSKYYVGRIESAASQSYAYNYDTYKYFPVTSTDDGGYCYVSYSRKGVERSITKPLIVVEGYDAHHAAPNIVTYNNTYIDFINAINAPRLTYDFNYHLDDIGGYDLIFVDFTVALSKSVL